MQNYRFLFFATSVHEQLCKRSGAKPHETNSYKFVQIRTNSYKVAVYIFVQIRTNSYKFVQICTKMVSAAVVGELRRNFPPKSRTHTTFGKLPPLLESPLLGTPKSRAKALPRFGSHAYHTALRWRVTCRARCVMLSWFALHGCA